MRRSRILLVSTMLVALLGISTDAAFAECEDPSLEDALAGASAVFIGEVTDARFESAQATLRVLWIWKGGDIADDVVVESPEAAPFPFRVGAIYVVIPQDTTAPFELIECSGTRMYRGDGEVVPVEMQDAVGAAIGRAPGDELSNDQDAGSSSKGLLLAVGLGVIGVVVFGIRWLKSRAESDERSGRHWRRVGGPLSWSVRSGGRQIGRMRRTAKARRRKSSE